MKNLLAELVGVLLLIDCYSGFCNNLAKKADQDRPDEVKKNEVVIRYSPQLGNLAANWIANYHEENPGILFHAGTLSVNEPGVSEGISLVSDDSDLLNSKTHWRMVIGREAVVAVINSENPMLDKIYSQGVTSDDIKNLFYNSQKRNWRSMIEGGMDVPLQFYTHAGNLVKQRLLKFAGSQEGVEPFIPSRAEIFTALSEDKYAVGFCRFSDILNSGGGSMVAGVRLLPIDRNQNGRIDYFEDFYGSPEDFERGVRIGKYPGVLCGNIYAVSPSKPVQENETAFLSWIIGGGQKFLNPNGYSELVGIQKLAGAEALNPPVIMAEVKDGYSLSKILQVILFSLAIAGIVVTVFAMIRKKVPAVSEGSPALPAAFNETVVTAPGGVFFDKTHLWAFMEKNGMVRIGIDDFLPHVTGNLTQVKMKPAGEMVRKGEEILTVVHNGKKLNLYSPVSGTVIEHNLRLITDSSLINTSPFNEGWVYILQPKNWLKEIQFLFMGDSYRKWLSDEFSRLRDFFAASLKTGQVAFPQTVLQDGGEITTGALADLGPEMWEEFQINFINLSK